MLADDGQDRIRVKTNKGKVGYRIVKFQLMPNDPGGGGYENVVQIWKVKQSAASDTMNFDDQNLLGAAYLEGDASRQYPSGQTVVIFDNEVFNQDIYITHKDDDQTSSVNYYLELEAIDLTDIQQTQITLKSLRTLVSR